MKIRQATIEDLSSIHALIHESFTALIDCYPSLHDMVENAIKDIMSPKGDLHETTFMKTYQGVAFWVVEIDGKVSGCIALKRIGKDEGELVRMSVKSSIRSQGIGNQLFQTLENFCLSNGILRITLSTGNPKAGSFYIKKCGFKILKEAFIPKGDTTVHFQQLVKYLGERIIRNVAIVGGTHGNERIGVTLVSQWMEDASEVSRSSFNTVRIFGNPAAVLANRRFIDADLNRQFVTNSASISSQPSETITLESQRAMQLQNELGHKRKTGDSIEGSNTPAVTDFIIDLHTSNSNVGLMCMVSAGDRDPVATRLAYHLQQLHPDMKIAFFGEGKEDSWSVDSIAPSGVAFEVGPCVHGVVSYELLATTRLLVKQSLDFIEHTNNVLLQLQASTGAVDGDIVRAPLPSHDVVPRPVIQMYSFVSYVNYPGTHTSTSSDFIVRHAVHPSLLGKDFLPIVEGDNVFISTDGRETMVPFTYPIGADGTVPSPQDRKELFAVFINEAAYASRFIALALYAKSDTTVY